MKILFATSEATPFVKTGGLADVCGSLPQALAKLGHEVRVILPLYERIDPEWREQMTYVKNFHVRLAWRNPYCGIFQLKREGVTYYFVDNEYYFKRWDIYGHYDDAERFAFFSRAVVEAPEQLDFAPDIIHCNDWQTALVPIYLTTQRGSFPTLGTTKSVFTIHNIEYQGQYGHDILGDVFGLPEELFHPRMLAHYGDVNLMKGAIYAADFITTVSPSYARELRYDFYAHGLAGVIAENDYKIRGILNGLDVDAYDPWHDKALPKLYNAKQPQGKRACKTNLQRQFGLKGDPDVPIIGCVSRLVQHKGFDLVTSALPELLNMDIQMVVLGTGELRYEETFRQAAWQHPDRFSAQIAYSDAMATAIYSGADLFLMPSVAEPCGLSQMIAMRYGTLPIVRETGGLKDSVQPWNQYTGEGNGFSFADINKDDMLHVIYEATQLYRNNKKAWKALQRSAMTTGFSWDRSAREYDAVYQQLTGA